MTIGKPEPSCAAPNTSERTALHSVVIVGPGAMGLLFAVRLAQAGRNVCLLDHRPERAAQLRRDGIRLIDDADEWPPTQIPVFESPKDFLTSHTTDTVLFSVKAYSTEAAVAHAEPLRASGPLVVTLQNGIGNAEVIARTFGQDRVLVGTTSEGATLLEPDKIRHAGRGVTRLGSLDPRRIADAENVVTLLCKAGFKARTTLDWRAALWAKAIVNAAINPIAALLQTPNGYLADSPAAREVVRTVAREGQQIARAQGIDVPHDLPDQAVSICRDTATNRASMLQDVERGRRTELPFINDILLQEAERNDQRAPVLKTVTELARARERAALSETSAR